MSDLIVHIWRENKMENKETLKRILTHLNKELYPNCSEVVWRLDLPDKRSTKEKIVDTLMEIDISNQVETDTSSFPNDCLDIMINIIEEAKKQGVSPKEIELTFIDNLGGGGDGCFVESCFVIALEHAEGKITRKQAKDKESKLWEGEEDADPDG